MTFFQELLRLKWRLVTYIGLYGLDDQCLNGDSHIERECDDSTHAFSSHHVY